MADEKSSDISWIPTRVFQGERAADERLFQRVYPELKAMARRLMSRERQGHTLQPSALINEAYLQLAPGNPEWRNRAHFFGAAAEAMRRVLVEHARRRKAAKRGGGIERVTFDELNVEVHEPAADVVALDEALQALSQVDERLADVVRMRFFAGLTIEETAAVLNRSPATVKRDWTYARAWLYERMTGDPSSD